MSAPKAISQKTFAKDPLWYKDAVIYQLHIRAFYDSNQDGIGDFKGLIEKLDYLKDLGINTVWVLPFYPSPLKDDGYDISDYENINPQYGDLDDFRAFLAAAHQRNIRVVTELVINHTSDQHDWFQRARRDKPDGYWRNFYVWSDDPHKYKGVRVIFRDFEASNWTYDPVAKSYYWHRFYSHQPDLNFDNPEVKKRIFQLVDYWMEMGVDGMRLDAVPYLFEREGTSCENLPETHAFLKEMRAYLDQRYTDRMLLAEANQWPEDAVAYFGDGDECHMNFHFPIMPRLFMAVRREDRFSIIDIMRQTPDIPDNCQWAMFLRNHDELTLEMVTDEERDYMYNAYAAEARARINLGIRRRLAPLLNNDRRQIELLNGILFSMPGTPIIYYGDEIGMGDNIYLGDRNGVRTPFQWSPDRNAGFSRADPQQLFLPVIMSPEYHYTTVNVETQASNTNSLMQWMRSLIEMRKQNIALRRGKLTFLNPANEKVLAFIRDYQEGEQTVLILANLSKRAQYVELDLAAWRGLVPVEMRGDTAFPAIGELPYLVMLGPYDFYWFELTGGGKSSSAVPVAEISLAHLPAPQDLLNNAEVRQKFESALQEYLPKARWYAGKDHTIRRVTVRDIVPVNADCALMIAQVQYRDQRDKFDPYLLTVQLSEGAAAAAILANHPESVICAFALEAGGKAVYHDAANEIAFDKDLLKMILQREHKNGLHGVITGDNFSGISANIADEIPEPVISAREQSNSSVRFGDEFFLKLYRHLDEGKNPEIEIGRHLTNGGFAHAPALIGDLTYKAGNKVYSLGVLHAFTAGKMSAWDLFKMHLNNFSIRAAAEPKITLPDSPTSFFDMQLTDLPPWFQATTAEAAAHMHLLGQRTGELHIALADSTSSSEFYPEDMTLFYQRSLYQSLRNRAMQVQSALGKRSEIPATAASLRDQLLKGWDAIDRQFDGVRRQAFGGKIIRIHGDFHLGQIIFTGSDFTMLDFEGEPRRPISTRRLKRSPLVDVAGLLRSIDYEVCIFAAEHTNAPALRLWALWMMNRFFEGYKAACANTDLLPNNPVHLRYLTETLVLEKALYEIDYEMGSRPEWVAIPLQGVLDLLPTLSSGKN